MVLVQCENRSEPDSETGANYSIALIQKSEWIRPKRAQRKQKPDQSLRRLIAANFKHALCRCLAVLGMIKKVSNKNTLFEFLEAFSAFRLEK